MIIKTLF